MATLEKPKKRRTKKQSKQKQVVLANDTESDEDIKKPPTQHVQLIPEISCPTVHKESINLENETEENQETNLPQTSIEHNITEASAPPPDEKFIEIKSNMLPEPTKKKYPNLQKLKYEENATEIIYSPTIHKNELGYLMDGNKRNMSPFSEEQLKEFYNCTELELVNNFELDFLMNSLLVSYEVDPLRVLLQEYYNLESKLSMLRLDVEEIRKEVEKSKNQIWTKSTIKKTFSGRCVDGKNVSETVTYE